jgi:hypothetical protein
MTTAEATCRPQPYGHADNADNALPNMHPMAEMRTAIEFGRLIAQPHRRELVAEGQSMKLGGRAFDVLMALASPSGVSPRLRVVRFRRRVASRASIRAMALPTAEGVIPRRSAARVKLPVSTAWVKGRRPWRLPGSIMTIG